MNESLNPQTLAKFFDHTLLKADATFEGFEKLCSEAAEYGFAMVAINPFPVPFCADQLRGTGVNVGAAIAFPLGQLSIEAKVWESIHAIEQGADEIDYVVNLTELKAGNRAYVADEMAQIVEACRSRQVISKVIFENCYLTEDEKLTLCQVAAEVRPDFVKTSTGFGTGGATFADVELMVKNVGEHVKVKAAGGVRTLADALRFIELGVSRIGSSSGVSIVDDFKAQQ